ncbi:phage tail protein [Arcobacter sp. YIC-80]|uniref:phage tail protein n=1 Tax=Arcobacter sp. YIC-80 TaxID=3376683 RepID=UPI00384EA239
MAEPYLGEIRTVGFNFAPRGWALCEGQLLSINQYQALFSLLGTTYGGDGRTTFALPDLRGRTSIGVGKGAGLSQRRWGERSGSEMTILNLSNLPSHNHLVVPGSLHVHNAAGNQDTIDSSTKSLAISATADRTPVLANNSFSTEPPTEVINDAVASSVTGNTGGTQAFNNMQPYLALYHIIALVGVFPSRNY